MHCIDSVKDQGVLIALKDAIRSSALKGSSGGYLRRLNAHLFEVNQCKRCNMYAEARSGIPSSTVAKAFWRQFMQSSEQ